MNNASTLSIGHPMTHRPMTETVINAAKCCIPNCIPEQCDTKRDPLRPLPPSCERALLPPSHNADISVVVNRALEGREKWRIPISSRPLLTLPRAEHHSINPHPDSQTSRVLPITQNPPSRKTPTTPLLSNPHVNPIPHSTPHSLQSNPPCLQTLTRQRRCPDVTSSTRTACATAAAPRRRSTACTCAAA